MASETNKDVVEHDGEGSDDAGSGSGSGSGSESGSGGENSDDENEEGKSGHEDGDNGQDGEGGEGGEDGEDGSDDNGTQKNDDAATTAFSGTLTSFDDQAEKGEDGETVDSKAKAMDLTALKELVEKKLKENPPEVMKKLSISHIPQKKKKQVRALEKMLYRIKLDQRHSLHDPRFHNAKKIRLGAASVKVFNTLLKGYDGGDHVEDLTDMELKAMERANKKEEVSYANPAEEVLSRLLPSPYVEASSLEESSSDSSSSEEDSTTEETSVATGQTTKSSHSFMGSEVSGSTETTSDESSSEASSSSSEDDRLDGDLTKERRDKYRHTRKAPPKRKVDIPRVPRAQAPPGMTPLPELKTSKNNENYFNYDGKWRDGKMHGHGTYYFVEDGTYVGDWENGRQHGHGVSKYRNGATYEGHWKNGRFEGKGKITMKNGNIFEGEFKEGLRNGPGTFTGPSGITYIGNFQAGLRHGRGREQNANGSYYMGYWKKDRIDGPGTLQLKGEDEVRGHHTQRFTKKHWDGSLRLRLPSAIAYIKQTVKREILERQEYLRNLTAPLDKMALETYVAEVRELNQQEERDRLMEEEREKRKALEERREKVRKAREDARKARGVAVEDEDPGGDD